MPVSWEICHPSIVVLLYLLLLNSSAGGLMVFSAVSMVSSSEVDNDIILLALGENPPPPKKNKKQKTHDWMLHYALLVQLGLKWSGKNHTHSWLKWFIQSEMVWYLAVSTHTLGPFHSKREWARCWQWKFSHSLFCLLSNTNCFWTQGTDYDL